jgi:predicted nucleotidyltransferase
VLGELERLGYPSCLVGGLAVSARAEPRFTRDIDLAIAVASDQEAERIVGALGVNGYKVLATVEQQESQRLATVRMLLPAERGVVTDLLFASSGIEPEVVAQGEPIEILPGLAVRVATTGHLLALKVLARDDARRPQDRVDLRSLLLVADERERQRAREALALIQNRGYHRGRDLLDAWEQLQEEHR